MRGAVLLFTQVLTTLISYYQQSLAIKMNDASLAKVQCEG